MGPGSPLARCPRVRCPKSVRGCRNPDERTSGLEIATNEGSGGLGAVSIGISEPIVLIVLVALALLVVFVGWKLVKLILAAIAG